MLFGKYDLDKIVDQNHPLRKINQLVSFLSIVGEFTDLANPCGRKGYGVETPDHTYFSRIRKALGTQRIATAFRLIREKATGKGILRQVFSFVDSSVIKVKETTWEERDKALKEGEEALNNQNIQDYSADKDARFGCKGKNKFWFGYKKHASVDMGSGLIKAIAVTPANVTDQEGLKHICPNSGMVFGDKQYCCKKAQNIMRNNNCHSGAIMKNNMIHKNKSKDRWL